jgi:hypothetical protein
MNVRRMAGISLVWSWRNYSSLERGGQPVFLP